ncbi:MAG TPA: energy transducer TonB [Candidatus Eremiobacteraceae bacterium]|nr:energy transducer TonB [Candidatus Eremiobacteraceae bacterium]
MKRLLSAIFVSAVLVSGAGARAGSLPADFAQLDSFFVHRVDANYPQSAKDQMLEGDVTILVHVDRNGHVLGAQIARSSGHSILDESALRAAIESSYVQARSSMFYSVLYTFRIGGFQRHAGAMMVR